MVPRPILVDGCLESVAGVLAAEQGGADRVELCAGLAEGGLTPSAATIRLAKERAHIPVMVMIRPRAGDFLYSALEFEVMQRDIEVGRQCGADGVVFGLLTADGRVDRERTARLLDAARPLSVTFHRAFDMTRDPREALETLGSIGVDRVLTSGQEKSAAEGMVLLRELVAQGGVRIAVMPGAGIDEHNAGEVARRTGARELHFAALSRRQSAMRHRNQRPDMSAGPAPGEFELQETDAGLVRRVVVALG